MMTRNLRKYKDHIFLLESSLNLKINEMYTQIIKIERIESVKSVRYGQV
jgi:hypothetical protein